ncbi:MAG: hypothetical protein NDI77_12415 [Geobacteraceae bacterium]|nr:hypothetical protein [Geobacteraceae bacterium]
MCVFRLMKWSVRVFLLAGAALICGCPLPKQVTMEGSSLAWFSPGSVDVHDRQIILLGGQQLELFELTLTGSNLSDSAKVKLLDAAGTLLPDELQLRTDGEKRTISIPSDAVIFSFDHEGSGGPANINVHRVVFQPSGALPAPETERQRKMKSFPLRAYEPVHILFPSPATDPMSYSFTYNREDALGEGDFDLIVEGPATVRAFRESDTFFADNGRALATADGTSGGFASIRLDGDKFPLLLRVSNDRGTGGHVRLYIGKPLRRLRVTLDLIGRLSDYGGNIDEVRQDLLDTVDTANYYLYMATAGRVRIDGLTARIRLLPPPPSDLPDGVVNDPDQGAASTTNLPGRPMRFPMTWWEDSALSRGKTLAHELLHQRFNLPDEYAKLPGQPAICPNTMMGDGLIGGELCWSRTHRRKNPDVAPVTLSAQSGWGQMAQVLGIPEPTHSPPEVLQNGQGRFPFPVDLQVFEVQPPSPDDVADTIVDGILDAVDGIR